MKRHWRRLAAVLGAGFIVPLVVAATVGAAGQFPNQQATGSVGLQGTISANPPTRAATITVPGNGASFSAVPITVSGICPPGVLVKIFDNNVFVGSTVCVNGSYSLQINLFSGKNDLVARVYDAQDQAGPDSNMVTVTYNDAQFTQFGTHVSLTSIYAQRGAPPNQEISWPIILSGGNGPYAVSVDWGDGTTTDLMTQQSAGTFTIKHTYRTGGVYPVLIKAVDKNGGTAFLQLTAQATGASQSNNKSNNGQNSVVKIKVLWWPAVAMLPLIPLAFWVGRRYELYVLRKQLDKQRKA